MKMMTAVQAAEYIGVSLSTMAKWRVAGGGPPYRKLGARVVYAQEEVERWLATKPAYGNTSQYTVEGRHPGRPPRGATA